MIICRTPLRISFFGGGTDYPSWYRERGGSVLNSTINKYSYITLRELPPFFDYKYRARYFEQEFVSRISEIKHPSIRACLQYLNVTKSLEVVHNSDLPARSGLGSSSTFTVGMLHALHALHGRMCAPENLAREAIHVEQNVIGEAVGSQDQVSAAFGGLNVIEFSSSREFDVRPVPVSRNRLEHLQSHLLLCFTGFARTAAEIAEVQIRAIPKREQQLNQMQDLVTSAADLLSDERMDINVFGSLLHESWMLKKSLIKEISNEAIDSLYQRARRAGARGGKLLGAGGGGFLLFFADPSKHESIKDALSRNLFVPFRFEDSGSQIIYFSYE